jgi:hypothetical protein
VIYALPEGALTFSVGVASFFMMPASAVQTKTWFRPNGWFSDRELSIAVNRVLRDDPSKGDMHNRQVITPLALLRTLGDYNLWPLYMLGLVAYIPHGPPARYITLIFKSTGFSTVGWIPRVDMSLMLMTFSSIPTSLAYLIASFTSLRSSPSRD